MKNLAFVFVVACAFCTTAMASDLALYIGPPNDGWYSPAQVPVDAQTIVDEAGSLFRDVSQFDDSQLDELGAWMDERMDDGKLDIVWLNGTMPSTLYPFPNLEPDGSRAELWLDGGNMLINVADWFGYMSYEGGTRSADNGGTGAANILDLSSGVIASADGTTLPVTAEGQEYMPSLAADDPVHSDRPVILSAVTDPWEVVAIFAGNATQADPVVIHNTETDGYVAFINQANLGNSVADRGLTSAEFIMNWVNEVIGLGGGGNPLARRPDPEDGAKVEATWGTLTWKPGYYAVSHDVYIGDNFDDVNDGAAHTFAGNTGQAMQIVGFVGFPLENGLVPGTTYYWRIDEVNDANAASPWKGNVWSFWVPPKKSYNAVPTDGVGFVVPNATVSWTNGFGGKLAQMYFGTDSAEVEAGTGDAAKGPVVGTTFDPGPLENGTTYYWRVDQFDGAETHTGDVWSFTTVADIVVGDPDLQGWWTLDEGEGTTAVDWSGHGGHGSFVGDPQWVDGYQGSALEFDGGEFVNCGDNAATGVTADFTLAAWVKLNPGNAGQYLGIGGKLSRLGGSADYMGYALVRHSSNVFRLWVGDGDAANIIGVASSNWVYTDTNWHHVAGVREGQLNMLYVDGVRQAAGNASGFVPSDLFFQIGRQYSNTNTQRQFNGKIDDVRIYNKALTDAQIVEVMLGNKKLARSPMPSSDSVVDIRDVSSLTFSAGDGATSHDVYFGQDRNAVDGADNSSPEFQGNQVGTSLSLTNLVEFGGGDYYWRIDEVAADGTVTTGMTWTFTVPDYLIVDNFESYTNEVDETFAGPTIWNTWIDGFLTGTTGAIVGYVNAPFAETITVHNGAQAMPFWYDNDGTILEGDAEFERTGVPYYSETQRTWEEPQDWTSNAVQVLSLWFYGDSSNTVEPFYVALEDSAGNRKEIAHPDPAALTVRRWQQWAIPLADFSGVDPTSIKMMGIGVGDSTSSQPGGTGLVRIDDVELVR